MSSSKSEVENVTSIRLNKTDGWVETKTPGAYTLNIPKLGKVNASAVRECGIAAKRADTALVRSLLIGFTLHDTVTCQDKELGELTLADANLDQEKIMILIKITREKKCVKQSMLWYKNSSDKEGSAQKLSCNEVSPDLLRALKEFTKE